MEYITNDVSVTRVRHQSRVVLRALQIFINLAEMKICCFPLLLPSLSLSRSAFLSNTKIIHFDQCARAFSITLSSSLFLSLTPAGKNFVHRARVNIFVSN